MKGMTSLPLAQGPNNAMHFVKYISKSPHRLIQNTNYFKLRDEILYVYVS